MNGPWSANAQARYISSYDDDENGGAEIDSWTAYDLQAGWSDDVRGHVLSASVGALNLFDEAAPTVNTPLGYDTKVHDARGRVLYARISVQR
jgi:iron complex outermembrane receptor protein